MAALDEADTLTTAELAAAAGDDPVKYSGTFKRALKEAVEPGRVERSSRVTTS
jgi:hypothetical protein